MENRSLPDLVAALARTATMAHGCSAAASAEERKHMAELFELKTRFEIAFDEMAIASEGWPGIPES